MGVIEAFMWVVVGFIIGGLALGLIQRRRLVRSCRSLLESSSSESLDPGTGLRDVQQEHERRIHAVRREQSLSRRVAEERAIRAQRALEGLEDPVIVLDGDGAVAECNQAAFQLSEAAEDQKGSINLEELLPSRVAAREIADLARGLADVDLSLIHI